jgi:hypothetical protein
MKNALIYLLGACKDAYTNGRKKAYLENQVDKVYDEVAKAKAI